MLSGGFLLPFKSYRPSSSLGECSSSLTRLDGWLRSDGKMRLEARSSGYTEENDGLTWRSSMPSSARFKLKSVGSARTSARRLWTWSGRGPTCIEPFVVVLFRPCVNGPVVSWRAHQRLYVAGADFLSPAFRCMPSPDPIPTRHR